MYFLFFSVIEIEIEIEIDYLGGGNICNTYVLLRWVRGTVKVHSWLCIYVSFMWVGVELGEGRIGDSVSCNIESGKGRGHS